jgi:hypothetical protein
MSGTSTASPGAGIKDTGDVLFEELKYVGYRRRTGFDMEMPDVPAATGDIQQKISAYRKFVKDELGTPVCTENSIRVDDVTESPKLGE